MGGAECVEGIDALWRKRACIAGFLAFSLRYPTSELVEAAASGAWLQAAREISEALSGEKGVRRLDGAISGEVEFAALGRRGFSPKERELKAEATRLFVGAPKPCVQPYEGMFRIASRGGSPMMFVNRHCRDVEEFFARCGLAGAQGFREPLDHIATELELLRYLGCLACGDVRPLGTVEASDFPGGGASEAYRLFFQEHMALWVGDFACELAAQTRTDLYRAAAVLLSMFAKEEAAFLARQ